MTYPPQGPYDQQSQDHQGEYPGQGGPEQGGHPQQSDYPPSGHPASGGYPHTDPRPQQYSGFGPTRQLPPDPYGQPGQFRQSGETGGFSGGEPPKKPAMRLGLSVAAVLLIAAALFTGFVVPGWFTSGDKGATNAAGSSSSTSNETKAGGGTSAAGTGTAAPTKANTTSGGSLGSDDVSGSVDRSNPQPVGETWAAAYNSRNADVVAQYTCGNLIGAERRQLARAKNTINITGTATISGATAKIPVDVSGKSTNMPLRKEKGQWCVSLTS